jgi:sugar phosphate isomerase/epimerase
MERLGLEFISTLGVNPVDAVRLASELGVHRVGMAPSPIAANPHDFAPWGMRTDPALVRATKAAARDHGVEIALGEGFIIMPGSAMTDAERAIDIMTELGAPVLNTCSVEQDRARALDEFARFAELAAARGLVACLEFLPLIWPRTIAEALDFVTASGAPNARLLLDAMHVYRSGGTTDAVASLDQAMIGYVQLCDAPLNGVDPLVGPDYGTEARDNRLCPGEGDLPLADFLAALPDGVTIGLEVPMVRKGEAGVSLRDALGPCVAAARGLLG